MTPDLSAGVDRVIRRAAEYATRRDDAQRAADRAASLAHQAGPLEAIAHWTTHAHAAACAAAYAADAGLCDISIALDRDAARDELRRVNYQPDPTAAEYAERIRRAIDANL